MACNSCSKAFSLLRREKGCPSCGFSYCSNCLKHKLFVPKLNAEVKVCMKCQQIDKNNEKAKLEPPDAYYKRIGSMDAGGQIDSTSNSDNCLSPDPGCSTDQEISNRLQKLKGDTSNSISVTNDDIASRLQKIKGDIPSTSDAELQLRLANLRGVPVSTLQSKPVTVLPDKRTDQEQVEDLMKQYLEHAKIDGNYQDDFRGVIDNIETRLQKLKDSDGTIGDKKEISNLNVESEDEDDIVNKIIVKAKAESRIGDDVTDPVLDELPFCEICNEDAKMRCLGCKYLFCKQCFMEHKDDDDGCDKYEFYAPPKGCH